MTAVISIITDVLSRDLVHVNAPSVSCALLCILSRALLVHSVEEQHSGSQCDCTAVRESGCLESCIRLATGIENSTNSVRLQAAWLVRAFSATSCVEGDSLEILKPYASAIYVSIIRERCSITCQYLCVRTIVPRYCCMVMTECVQFSFSRPSDDALKASLCAIAAQLVTECPYNDCIALLEAASDVRVRQKCCIRANIAQVVSIRILNHASSAAS